MIFLIPKQQYLDMTCIIVIIISGIEAGYYLLLHRYNIN